MNTDTPPKRSDKIRVFYVYLCPITSFSYLGTSLMELSPPNAYANQVTSGIMKPTFWLIKEATKQVLVDGKSRTR